MKLSTMCMRCVIDRQEERIRGIEDEDKKSAFLKKVAGIIAASDDSASAPYLVYEINKIFPEYFGELKSYEKEKKEFNAIMLEMEAELEKNIRAGSSMEEQLKAAMNYARTANYIDFGAMEHVEKDKLLAMLEKAEKEPIDPLTFASFSRDLKQAGRLVYLTDNCGEIVADKLLVKVLKEQYPKLEITVIVRGMPVLNDAAMEDAVFVGMTDITRVISNGNGVAGTQINLLSDEAAAAIKTADIIISKGQGNFETIHGCGLNIYYLFLCKCDWFSKKFGMERLKGVFINEREVNCNKRQNGLK